MKKLFSALIALAMVFCLTAFAEAPAIVNEDGTPWIAPVNGQDVTMETDLGVIVNGVYYQVYKPAEALLTALGEPMETVSSPSCVYVGEDFEYMYEAGSIYSSPIDGGNIWYEFYISAPGVSTTRGVSVGDTVEKLLEVYGQRYYSEGEGMYTYSLSNDPADTASPCLIFETDAGVIVTIDIYYPTNI